MSKVLNPQGSKDPPSQSRSLAGLSGYDCVTVSRHPGGVPNFSCPIPVESSDKFRPLFQARLLVGTAEPKRGTAATKGKAGGTFSKADITVENPRSIFPPHNPPGYLNYHPFPLKLAHLSY